MNPFETPPTTPLVSTDPPSGPHTTPRRGRMALVALASAGLLTGGIVGVSALATADDPELGAVSVTDDTVDDTEDEAPEEGTPDEEAPGDGSDEAPDGDVPDGDAPVLDLDVVLDLDEEQLARLHECVGLPMLPFDEWMAEGDQPFEFDLEFGEFGTMFEGEFGAELEQLFDEFMVMLDDLDSGEFGEFGEFGPMFEGEFGDFGEFGGQVTVTGPDGVTVIDLGDGDASVTISRDGDTGEVTITTDGTATEQSLEELFDTIFGEFGADLPLFSDEFGEFDEMTPEEFEELFGELPDLDQLITEFGEFGEFEEIDPEQFEEMFGEFGGWFEGGMFLEPLDLDAVADCLAELG